MEIYLDNAATTKPSKEALNEYVRVSEECYGNPSALHGLGLTAEKCVKTARDRVARSIGSTDKEIIFTSGGTESDNLAIIGVAEALKHKGKHLITSKIEHHAVTHTFKFLESIGYEVTYIDCLPDGKINLDQLKNSVRPDTILISIMLVNNETGVIQPVDSLKAIAPNAVIHSDCVQAYGKIPIDVNKLNIDLASFSAHKIHALKGVGALYVRKGTKIKPITYGGDQEGIRSGTLNTAGISAFGVQAEQIFKSIQNYNEKHNFIREKFIKELTQNIPDVYVNGNDSVGILNVGFDGLRGEVLLHALETKGIYVSTGSACTSKNTKISHVLSAMGVKQNIAEGSIRISFSADLTEEEILIVVEEIKKQAEMLRKFKRR